MSKIEKKTWSEYFQKILEGQKTFDMRIADFECSEGDTLVLREWDSKTKEYTGRMLEKTITHVLKTKNIEFWNPEEIKEKGFIVMSFK